MKFKRVHGQKRYLRGTRLVSWTMSFLLILGLFSPHFSIQAEQENEKGKVTLNLSIDDKPQPDAEENGVPIYRYPSGRGIGATVELTVSGAELEYEYAYMKITMPKASNPDSKYVQDVEFIDSLAASSTEQSSPDDPDEYSVTYHFRHLQGGFSGEYVFGFRFGNLITPNGARQPVHIGIYDQEGQLIADRELDVIFEAQSQTEYTVNKTVYDSEFKHYGFEDDIGAVSDLPIYTSTNPADTEVSFYHTFTPVQSYNISRGEGEYRAKRFKIVDTIPEGASLDLDKNSGWTPVEGQERVYEKIIEKDSNPYNISARIVLSFVKQPYKNKTMDTQRKREYEKTDVFTNHSVFYVDKGKGFVPVGSSEASVDFTAFRSTGGTFSVDKRIEDPNNRRTDNLMLINGDHPQDYRLFKSTEQGYLAAYPAQEAQTEGIWTWLTEFVATDRNNSAQRIQRIHDKKEIPERTIDGNRQLDGTYPTDLTKARFYYKRLRFFAQSTIPKGVEGMRTNLDEVLDANMHIYKINPPTDDNSNFTKFKNEGGYDPNSKTLVTTVKVKDALNGVDINDASGEYMGLSIEFDEGFALQNVRFGYMEDLAPVEEGGQSSGLDENGQLTTFTAGREKDFFARLAEYVQANRDDLKELKKIRAKVGSYLSYVDGSGHYRHESRWDNNSIIFRPKFASFDVDRSTLSPPILSYRTEANGGSYLEGSLTGKFNIEPGDDPSIFVAKNLRAVILLPAGVDYVDTLNSVGLSQAPVVVDNYMSTGRKAILYHFGDYRAISEKPSVSYRLSAGRSTPEGDQKIENWFVWDNPIELRAYQAAEGTDNHAEDIYNLDGIARSRVDTYVKRDEHFIFVLPGEVILQERVSEKGDVWSDEAAYLDIGTHAKYRLDIYNLRKKPLEHLTVIDGLPEQGDKKLVDNELNEYLPRGSKFHMELTGKLSDLTENERANRFFRYEYTKHPVTQTNYIIPSDTWVREEDTNQWTEEDWAEVTSFRAILIQSLPGKSLQEGTEESGVVVSTNIDDENDPTVHRPNYVPIYVPIRAPKDKSLAIFSKAYNAVAFSTNENREDAVLNYHESNEVRTSIVHYRVSGTVFRDVPMNGQIKKKNRLSNRQVSLVYGQDVHDPDDPDLILHHQGDLVLQDSGQPVQMRTDEKGHYDFKIYQRGTYQIRFELEDNQERFTSINHLDSQVEKTSFSHVDLSTQNGRYALSSPFTVSPYSMKYRADGSVDQDQPSLHYVRNAGILDCTLDVHFSKLGVNRMLGQTLASGQPLAEVAFVLRPLNASQEAVRFVTDEQGQALVERLPFGRYELDEESAPEHYQKNPTIQLIVDEQGVRLQNPEGGQWSPDEIAESFVYDADLSQLSIENKVIDAHLKIIKKDALSHQPIPGVQFYLLKDGQVVTKQNDEGQMVRYVVETDENGEALFEHIGSGQFLVKEARLPEGYAPFDGKLDLQNEGKPVRVVANAEGQVVTLNLTNNHFRGTIRLVKTDGQDQQPIEGAQFALYHQADWQANGHQAQVVQTGKTDSNGHLNFISLARGRYVVVETQAAFGYQLNAEPQEVKVNQDGRIRIYKMSFVNEPYFGSIRVRKVDHLTRQPLVGAEFKLQIKKNQKWIDVDQTLVQTNAQGIAEFTHLRMGDYRVIETQAPTGYRLDKEGLEVALRPSDREADEADIVHEIDFINERLVSDVILKKIDARTKQGLAKARFALEPMEENGQATLTATSQQDGQVYFSQVPYGVYRLVELEAPQGYHLNSQTMMVNVDGQTSIIELGQWENKPIAFKVQIDKQNVDHQSLTGSILSIFDEKGNRLESWRTNGQVKTLSLATGTYVLKEEQAPSGYQKITDLTLKVDEQGQPKVIKDTQTAHTSTIKDNRLIVVDEKEGSGPHTGTRSDMTLWMGLLVISILLMLIVWIGIKKRKRH